MTTAPVLEVRGVAKRYGATQALGGVDLTLEVGTIHGLIGANGSGKSTLLKSIAGVVGRDAGSILLDGKPLPVGDFRATSRLGIGMIPQEVALAPALTVWENIVLGNEPRRFGLLDRRRGVRTASTALAQMECAVSATSLVGDLSPVSQRMVMLARAAALPHVRVLLVDEPTAGLPQQEAAQVLEAIKSLRSDRRAIMLVTHHLDDIVAGCSSVTALRDGRVFREFRGDEVTKRSLVDVLIGEGGSTSVREHRSAATGPPLVELDHVAAGRLHDLSLAVRRGEIVGIAGLLGSGNREAVDLMVGVERPSAGQVTVGSGGRSPKTPHHARRAGVGFVPGDRGRAVIPAMTVAQNVTVSALDQITRHGLTSSSSERRQVADVLERLDVKVLPKTMMTALSGGNQQRALLGRWMVADVSVLVVDQPSVGVDIQARELIFAALRELSRTHAVVVLAESDELSVLCDRVVCLRKGRQSAELVGAEVTEVAILEAIA